MGTAAQKKLNNHGMAWIFAIMLVLIVILSITAMIPTYKKYQEQGKRVACATALDTARRQLASKYMLNCVENDSA